MANLCYFPCLLLTVRLIRLNHDCPGQINQMPRQTQSSYATLNREKVQQYDSAFRSFVQRSIEGVKVDSERLREIEPEIHFKDVLTHVALPPTHALA